MTPWRIYRLPGSRHWWHVDAGPNTGVVNVLAVQSQVPMRSVDIGGDSVPRAWFEVEGELLVSANGQVAQFVSLDSMKLETIIEKSRCTLEVMDAAEKLADFQIAQEEKTEKKDDGLQ